MKLDLIAAENRFITSGRAHQAMNDVESLVALCRKLSQKQDVWTYCLNFFDRVKDVKRISAFQETMEIQGRSFKPGLMLSVSFGAAAGYLAPVLYLGRSVPYQNQGLWLRLDAEPATDRTDKNSLSMPVIRKRDGDGYFVLPPLQRFWEKVSETARVSATGHLENIRKEGKRFLESVDAHLEYRYPDVPDIDPDAALYQMGFFSTREKAQCHLFHQTPDDRKYGFVNQLDAGRIRELALRIIFRNEMPVPLDTDAQKMYERYLSRVYLSPQDHGIKGYQAETKLGCLQALEELEELKRKVLPDRSGTSQNKQISALKAYLENLSKLSG